MRTPLRLVSMREILEINHKPWKERRRMADESGIESKPGMRQKLAIAGSSA
jgi:hypothetical protein